MNIKSFKAFRIHEKGGKIEAGFEKLALKDLTPGEVVIAARYSDINYKDALAATGAGKILRRYPLVGGIDVAGHVVDSQDERFRPGDPVVVTGCALSEEYDGGYAEYVRVRADSVIPLPAALSPLDAMRLGTAGFTAALAIHRIEHNGQTPDNGPIVVTGATGGVGSLAVNMLAGAGYEVVAVTGKADATGYLESLGASQVLRRQDIELGTRPLEKALWAGAIDNLGGDVLAWLTRTVGFWGNIASIGLAASHELHTTVMPFILRGVNLLGVNSVATPRDLREQVWSRLASDLLPGKLDTIGARIIKFDELPSAFADFIEGKVTGRIVVQISEDSG